MRPRNSVLPDASNHPQWNKAERASEKKRSSALTWGRQSLTIPEANADKEDDAELVAEARTCRKCASWNEKSERMVS